MPSDTPDWIGVNVASLTTLGTSGTRHMFARFSTLGITPVGEFTGQTSIIAATAPGALAVRSSYLDLAVGVRNPGPSILLPSAGGSLWLPLRFWAPDLEYELVNPTAAAFDIDTVEYTAQLTNLADQFPRYLAAGEILATIAALGTSAPLWLPQAALYDYANVAVTGTRAMTVQAVHASMRSDTVLGFTIDTYTETLGAVAGAGTVFATVPVRGQRLEIQVRNDDAVNTQAPTVSWRTYRNGG